MTLDGAPPPTIPPPLLSMLPFPAQDVSYAIEFAQTLNDDDLWDLLIDKAVTKVPP